MEKGIFVFYLFSLLMFRLPSHRLFFLQGIGQADYFKVGSIEEYEIHLAEESDKTTQTGCKQNTISWVLQESVWV